MNFRDTLIVTRFDYRNLVRSAPGVIFLVVYLFLAVLMGTLLTDMLKEAQFLAPGAKASPAEIAALLSSDLAKFIAWFVEGDAEMVRYLVLDRPIVMSAFLLTSLFVVPFLVLLLSFNQVSSYVSRRSIRYIVLKTGRLELYLGLFFSNLLFFTVISGVLATAMTLGWVLVSKQLSFFMVVGFSLRIFVAIWFAAVPCIAFMSMLAAMLGSPVATIFLGLGIYLFIDIAGSLFVKQSESFRFMLYILPLQPKYWFAQPGVGAYLGGMILMLAYTAAFLAVGWVFLRRRNV